MEKVKDLIKEIGGVKTCTSSKKDELRVMRAMMNDMTYKVAVYDSNGPAGFICPSELMRNTCASVMSSAAKIPLQEANHLMAKHEFKRSDAENMINFSKEFINTYISTERKLPLGGRERSNNALTIKHNKAGWHKYPKQVGEHEDGKPIFATGKKWAGAYDTVRTFGPVPAWLPKEDPPKDKK